MRSPDARALADVSPQKGLLDTWLPFLFTTTDAEAAVSWLAEFESPCCVGIVCSKGFRFLPAVG